MSHNQMNFFPQFNTIPTSPCLHRFQPGIILHWQWDVENPLSIFLMKMEFSYFLACWTETKAVWGVHFRQNIFYCLSSV